MPPDPLIFPCPRSGHAVLHVCRDRYRQQRIAVCRECNDGEFLQGRQRSRISVRIENAGLTRHRIYRTVPGVRRFPVLGRFRRLLCISALPSGFSGGCCISVLPLRLFRRLSFSACGGRGHRLDRDLPGVNIDVQDPAGLPHTLHVVRSLRRIAVTACRQQQRPYCKYRTHNDQTQFSFFHSVSNLLSFPSRPIIQHDLEIPLVFLCILCEEPRKTYGRLLRTNARGHSLRTLVCGGVALSGHLTSVFVTANIWYHIDF